MNNQHYDFSNGNPSTPSNIPEGCHGLQVPYEGNSNDITVDFQQPNFLKNNDNFYQDVTSCQTIKEGNGEIVNAPNNAFENVDSGAYVSGRSSECADYTSLQMQGTLSDVYSSNSQFNATQQNEQSSFNEFSSQVREIPTLCISGNLPQFNVEQGFHSESQEQFAHLSTVEDEFPEFQIRHRQDIFERNLSASSLNEELNCDTLKPNVGSACNFETVTEHADSSSLQTPFLQVASTSEASTNSLNANVDEESTLPSMCAESPVDRENNNPPDIIPSAFESSAVALEIAPQIINEDALPEQQGSNENSDCFASPVEASSNLALHDEEGVFASPSLSTEAVPDQEDKDAFMAAITSPVSIEESPPSAANYMGMGKELTGDGSNDINLATSSSSVKIVESSTSIANSIEVCKDISDCNDVASPVSVEESCLSVPVLEKSDEITTQISPSASSAGDVDEVLTLNKLDVASDQGKSNEANENLESVSQLHDGNLSTQNLESEGAKILDEGKESHNSVTEMPEVSSKSVGVEEKPDDQMIDGSSENSNLNSSSFVITLLEDSRNDESAKTGNSCEVEGNEELLKEGDQDVPVRLTRTRTGALRNKTQRLVEELDASDDSSRDSVSYEDWEYEEGAELAPCKADPFITVPECVLKVTPDELEFYHKFFESGVEAVLKMRLHCTSCDKHVGAAPNYIHLRNRHKVLRVLICSRCQSFYGVGKFPRDSDGSELYCRWCGQGGEIICCSHCPNVFCEDCIRRNLGSSQLSIIADLSDWSCFVCNYQQLWELRAICWALFSITMQKKKQALTTNDSRKILELEDDKSKCCPSKHMKRRKPPKKGRAPDRKANASQHIVQAEDPPMNDNGEFRHFLFPDDDYECPVEEQQGNCGEEEDDFIDPSQFVQPVLEEPAPRPRRPPAQHSVQLSRLSTATPRIISTQIQPQMPQLRYNNVTVHSHVGGATPRLIIRQGNLLQPGLIPINKQPNSIPIPSIRPTLVTRSDHVASSFVPNKNNVRNQVPNLSNIDGVRSMEQLQSLEQVPWFRDGVDSIRAVGFALTKRIRELEARFHSLKNKSDVEKVLVLGKKLERLSRKTESRFRKINSNLNESCRRWYTKRQGYSNSRSHLVDPFSLCREGLSDWDDDGELSKPLEKVLIPVSAASLQGSMNRCNVRPVSTPPPLVRTTSIPVIPATCIARSQPRMSTVVNPAATVLRGAFLSQPVQNVSTLPQPCVVNQIRLPGPKSSTIRYGQPPIKRSTQSNQHPGIITERVGAFLNERNGGNSVSISLSSISKRKRLDSVDSDSDVEAYPTIPELIAMHSIKPCRVVLQRNDAFIASFLQRQKEARSQNAINIDLVDDSSESDSEYERPQVETIVIPCEVFEDSVTATPQLTFAPDKVAGSFSQTSNVPCNVNTEDIFMQDINTLNNGSLNDDDDDDDIEIIHEVNPSSNLQSV